MKLSNCLSILAVVLIAQKTSGQLEQFFANYGEQCGKVGAFLWLLNTPCANYNGSVECRAPTPADAGICDCNQGDNAYFDATQEVCLGKVGAACTAELTNLIPAKVCTPNADCISTQSEGHSVGTCRCLYGFKNENGLCVEDSEADGKSTVRVRTTPQPKDRGDLKLPPLDFLVGLIGGRIAPYGSECKGSFPLLNRTHCSLHGMTVACMEKACECNMGAGDAKYDTEMDQCVSLAGSYCLTRRNLIGFKGCVENAECELEDGANEDQSFGTCKCKYGFRENDDGTCTVGDGETPPTSTPSGGSTGGEGGSTGGEGGSTGGEGGSTGQDGETTTPGGAAQVTITSFTMATILSLLYLTY